MSLLQEPQIQTSVYICRFECFIRQANIAMKFPCSYFVEWRTINSKSTTKTERHNPHQNQVIFEEKIVLQIEMLFDHSKLQFLKRETIVELFLISKSRPDQNKLVGRVNIDLGKVINVGMYEQPTEFKLNFCSIEGTLIMQFKALDQKLTSLTIQDLDKSSFMDFISQTAFKAQNRNQSMILSRYESQSAEKRDQERVGRSQIRGISPGSPKSSSIVKASIISKHNNIKNQPERTSAPIQREKIPEFSKLREEEPELRKKLNTNSIKMSAEVNPQMDAEIYSSQAKRSFGKWPSGVGILDRTNQDEMLHSQTVKIENIAKTNSSPIFQANFNENLLLNEINNANEQIIQETTQKAASEQKELMGITKEYSKQKTEQNDKLKHQIDRLLNQNELLYEQKTKIENTLTQYSLNIQKVNAQVNKLQQQISQKNKIIDNYDNELTQKQSLITKLSEEINKRTQQYQQRSLELESLKMKVNQLETINKDLLKKIEIQQISSQQRISSYEEFIKNLEFKHEEDSQSISNYQNIEQTLKKKVESLQIQNNKLKNSLQKTKVELQGKVDAGLKQSSSLQKHQQEKMRLEIQIQRLQRELQNTLLRYDNAEKDVGEIQGKYFELETLYDEQISANQLLQQQLLDLRHKAPEITEEPVQEIILNTSEVLQTCDQVQEPNLQYQKLKFQNDSLVNEVQFLKGKTEMAEREFKNMTELLQNQNSALKQQILVLEGNGKQLQTKLDVIILNNQELLSDNRLLKEEITHLHKEVYEGETVHLIKSLQEENQQLREQARAVQGQVEFYEKELLVLKDQIIRIRQSRENKPAISADKAGEYEEMIGKLNANLEEQINQNTELSETIVRYMEKEAKMKETLAVLENESKEIFTLVQEKQQNQETYQKAIEELQIELLSYKNHQPPSPTRVDQHFNQQNQNLMEENQELMATIEQLKQTNSKLNDDLMQLSMEFNETKNKLEADVSNLTDSLINAEADSKREEEMNAAKQREYERSLKNKDIQLEIWKSRSKQREADYQALDAEVGRLRNLLEEIEEEKFNLQSTINEKDIKIIELQEEINQLKLPAQPSRKIEPESNIPTAVSTQIDILGELKEKLLQRNLNSDWDSLLQSILDRSLNGEDTSKLLNLQEKSRLLSKELQKMKAQLLKSDWRNQQEKLAAMGLFKKCESIVTQLIIAAESLNQNQSSFL